MGLFEYGLLAFLVLAFGLIFGGAILEDKYLRPEDREGYVAPQPEPELPVESAPTPMVVELASVRKQAEDLSEVALPDAVAA